MTADPTSALVQAARHGPFVIVMNGAAGRCDVPAVREQISAALAASGRAHAFIVADRSERLIDAVQRAAAQAREQGGVLVAVGGDGTINAVARAALDNGCPLGVVPQGTFNYFARALGIPDTLADAAACLASGRLAMTRVGLVNQRVFLVNASLGLYPQLLEDREAFLRQRGRNRLNAVLSSLVLAIRGIRQINLEREDEPRRRTPTLFVGHNRVQLARLGIRDELLDALDSHLVALSMRPISTWQMLGLILRGAVGRLGDADRIDSFAFRRMVVQPRGRRRLKVAIDGEVLTMRTPITLEIGSTPLPVVLPAAEQRIAPA